MKQPFRIANIKRNTFFARLLGKENKSYFNRFIDYYERTSYKTSAKKIDPWAFIRVSDEERTLEMSLESAAKIFNRGIITFNSCTDSTPEIIDEFCQSHPGFFYVEYPFEIIPANSPLLNDCAKNVPYKNTLAAYYNFALSLIPKGDWLCKIDGDHFHFAEVFNFGISRVQAPQDVIWFPRVDCYVDYTSNPPIPYGVKKHVGSDQWLIKNTDLYFENTSFTDENGYHAYEILRWRLPRVAVSTECASIHFPYEKIRRNQITPKKIIPWESFIKSLPYGFINPAYSDTNTMQGIIAKIKR